MTVPLQFRITELSRKAEFYKKQYSERYLM